MDKGIKMATLSTNFKDDIVDTSVNPRRRYRVYENTDGTIELEDVTEYSQVGDVFGAGQINATNTEVNKKFDKNMLVRDLDTINAITKEGYAPDALALKDINRSLTADNSQLFQFAYDNITRKYGYKVKEAGTDVFVPFSNSKIVSGIFNLSTNEQTIDTGLSDITILYVYRSYTVYAFYIKDTQTITDTFNITVNDDGTFKIKTTNTNHIGSATWYAM